MVSKISYLTLQAMSLSKTTTRQVTDIPSPASDLRCRDERVCDVTPSSPDFGSIVKAG